MTTERALITGHGRVVAVTEELAGDSLAVDATIGETVLFLEDATDFPEAGGLLSLQGESSISPTYVYEFTSADHDAATVTLAVALGQSWGAGTTVRMSPERRTRFAYIQLDDPEEPPILARVPFHMRGLLPMGQRSDVDGDDEDSGDARLPEDATVELIRGSWRITDVPDTVPVWQGTARQTELGPITWEFVDDSGDWGVMAGRYEGFDSPAQVSVIGDEDSGFTEMFMAAPANAGWATKYLMLYRTATDGFVLMAADEVMIVEGSRVHAIAGVGVPGSQVVADERWDDIFEWMGGTICLNTPSGISISLPSSSPEYTNVRDYAVDSLHERGGRLKVHATATGVQLRAHLAIDASVPV